MQDVKRRIQYYLIKSGLSDCMYGKVKNNQPYTERRFIEMMCEDNEKLNPDLVKEVMKTLMTSGIRALQDGVPLVISNFIRIYPSIKGSFEGTDDGFDNSRHTLNFNVKLAKPYVDKVLDGLVIEKIERPKENAFIGKIENVRTGGNELTKHFTNKLIGSYFLISGYNLIGIELSNAMDLSDEVMIGVEHLDIPTHTMREFAFSIVYNYELPAWLVDGVPIYINLVYKKIEVEGQAKAEKPISGYHFETVWKEL